MCESWGVAEQFKARNAQEYVIYNRGMERFNELKEQYAAGTLSPLVWE